MIQPTKEQVLRRMVEIEFPGKLKGPGSWVCDSKDAEGVMQGLFTWNPIDNPSDWAVLIEKHEISLWKEDGDWWAITKELDNSPLRVQNHPALPWAICLAVIEANGGMVEEEAE